MQNLTAPDDGLCAGADTGGDIFEASRLPESGFGHIAAGGASRKHLRLNRRTAASTGNFSGQPFSPLALTRLYC